MNNQVELDLNQLTSSKWFFCYRCTWVGEQIVDLHYRSSLAAALLLINELKHFDWYIIGYIGDISRVYFRYNIKMRVLPFCAVSPDAQTNGILNTSLLDFCDEYSFA